jgi:hypothetical protein
MQVMNERNWSAAEAGPPSPWKSCAKCGALCAYALSHSPCCFWDRHRDRCDPARHVDCQRSRQDRQWHTRDHRSAGFRRARLERHPVCAAARGSAALARADACEELDRRPQCRSVRSALHATHRGPGADYWFRSNGMSEDCLYLNVWTPAKSDRERLPVMVRSHATTAATWRARVSWPFR